ncbi:MAG: glutaredoxin family protein [Candidatus Bathyarchaeota archaeon]|nr:MAG: glutaredoxin family protein [Candidatus Bathyarchaeota archaeon]
MTIKRVEGGRTDHKVFIYALSTCGWCKRTKDFLKEKNVAYEYMDVDQATREEKREVGEFLKERNVPLGFPVTVIDDETVISGYKPEALAEALGL